MHPWSQTQEMVLKHTNWEFFFGLFFGCPQVPILTFLCLDSLSRHVKLIYFCAIFLLFVSEQSLKFAVFHLASQAFQSLLCKYSFVFSSFLTDSVFKTFFDRMKGNIKRCLISGSLNIKQDLQFYSCHILTVLISHDFSRTWVVDFLKVVTAPTVTF